MHQHKENFSEVAHHQNWQVKLKKWLQSVWVDIDQPVNQPVNQKSRREFLRHTGVVALGSLSFYPGSDQLQRFSQDILNQSMTDSKEPESEGNQPELLPVKTYPEGNMRVYGVEQPLANVSEMLRAQRQDLHLIISRLTNDEAKSQHNQAYPAETDPQLQAEYGLSLSFREAKKLHQAVDFFFDHPNPFTAASFDAIFDVRAQYELILKTLSQHRYWTEYVVTKSIWDRYAPDDQTANRQDPVKARCQSLPRFMQNMIDRLNSQRQKRGADEPGVRPPWAKRNQFGIARILVIADELAQQVKERGPYAAGVTQQLLKDGPCSMYGPWSPDIFDQRAMIQPFGEDPKKGDWSEISSYLVKNPQGLGWGDAGAGHETMHLLDLPDYYWGDLSNHGDPYGLFQLCIVSGIWDEALQGQDNKDLDPSLQQFQQDTLTSSVDSAWSTNLSDAMLNSIQNYIFEPQNLMNGPTGSYSNITNELLHASFIKGFYAQAKVLNSSQRVSVFTDGGTWEPFLEFQDGNELKRLPIGFYYTFQPSPDQHIIHIGYHFIDKASYDPSLPNASNSLPPKNVREVLVDKQSVVVHEQTIFGVFQQPTAQQNVFEKEDIYSLIQVIPIKPQDNLDLNPNPLAEENVGDTVPQLIWGPSLPGYTLHGLQMKDNEVRVTNGQNLLWLDVQHVVEAPESATGSKVATEYVPVPTLLFRLLNRCCEFQLHPLDPHNQVAHEFSSQADFSISIELIHPLSQLIRIFKQANSDNYVYRESSTEQYKIMANPNPKLTLNRFTLTGEILDDQEYKDLMKATMLPPELSHQATGVVDPFLMKPDELTTWIKYFAQSNLRIPVAVLHLPDVNPDLATLAGYVDHQGQPRTEMHYVVTLNAITAFTQT